MAECPGAAEICTNGYLEKPAPLAFRGTLRDLSIEGRVNNQRLTIQAFLFPSPKPPSR